MRPIEEPARNRAGVGHARAVGTAVKSCDAVELSEGRRASAKARLSPARARVDADRRRADPGRGHPASTIDHAGSADGPVPRLHPPEPDRTSREQVDLRGPLGPGSTGPIDLGAEAEAADTRRFRRAIFGAAALHLLLLGATFPEWTRPLPAAPARSTILVRTVRFRAPESRPAERIPPRKAKRIPIPDPTPADPEPMEVADRPIPDLDLDLDPLGLEAFAIPDAPPGRTGPAPVHLGEGILPPRKVFAPRPRYAEEARQARLQGVVVLMAVIDEKGEVAEIEVLKGLGLGLTESAVETVRGWKFEPATRAGEPVAVYMNLVVSFRLQ